MAARRRGRRAPWIVGEFLLFARPFGKFSAIGFRKNIGIEMLVRGNRRGTENEGRLFLPAIKQEAPRIPGQEPAKRWCSAPPERARVWQCHAGAMARY